MVEILSIFRTNILLNPTQHYILVTPLPSIFVVSLITSYQKGRRYFKHFLYHFKNVIKKENFTVNFVSLQLFLTKCNQEIGFYGKLLISTIIFNKVQSRKSILF